MDVFVVVVVGYKDFVVVAGCRGDWSLINSDPVVVDERLCCSQSRFLVTKWIDNAFRLCLLLLLSIDKRFDEGEGSRSKSDRILKTSLVKHSMSACLLFLGGLNGLCCCWLRHCCCCLLLACKARDSILERGVSNKCCKSNSRLLLLSNYVVA